MTISSTFRAAIAHSNELDKRLARRIGQHLDTTSQLVREIAEEPKQLALPPAIPAGDSKTFGACSMTELKDLAKRFKVPGRSVFAKHIKGKGKDKTAERKRLLVALLVEHGTPALTYDNLLNFYLQTTQAQ